MMAKYWVITICICLLYMPPDCYSRSNNMQYQQLHRLIQKLLPRLREPGNHHVILIHQHTVPNKNAVQHSSVNGASANAQAPGIDQENPHAPDMDQIEARKNLHAPAMNQIEARTPAIYQTKAHAPARDQNEARAPARDQNEALAPARDHNEARAPAVETKDSRTDIKHHMEAPTPRVVSDFANIQHGPTNTSSSLFQNNGTQDSGNNDDYPTTSHSDLSLRESSTSHILRDINSKTPLGKKSDQSASQSTKQNQYNKKDTSQSDVEHASSKRTIPVVMETEVPEPIRTVDSKYPHIQSMEKFKLAQQSNDKALQQSDARILSMSKIANLDKIQKIPFFKGIGGKMATKSFNTKGKNQRLTNKMLRDFNESFSKLFGKQKHTQPLMASQENDLTKSRFSSQAAPGDDMQSSTRNSNWNWSHLSAVMKKGLRLQESDRHATNDFPMRDTNVMQQASVNSNEKSQISETVPKTAPSKPSGVKQHLNSGPERFQNQKSSTHVNNVIISGHAHPLTVTNTAPPMQDTDPLAVERALLYGRHALVPSGQEKSGTDRDPSQAPSWNDLGLKAPDAKDTSYETLEQLLLHQP